MTIYSYEQIQAMPAVRDNGGKEDKLVKWVVAQSNAHCATLEPTKRLVFKILPEFRKADVLVRRRSYGGRSIFFRRGGGDGRHEPVALRYPSVKT
jgi:hypothetical protein